MELSSIILLIILLNCAFIQDARLFSYPECVRDQFLSKWMKAFYFQLYIYI